jgi:hypothetical protein
LLTVALFREPNVYPSRVSRGRSQFRVQYRAGSIDSNRTTPFLVHPLIRILPSYFRMVGGGDYAFKFTESTGFRLCLLEEDHVRSINGSANKRNIYPAHQSVSFESTRATLLKLVVLRIKEGMDSVSNFIACITTKLQIAFAPHLFRAGPQHSFECGFSYVWKSVVTRYYLAQSHNFLSNYTAFQRQMKRLP